MANFSSLKQAIETYIKQNGNNEITGALLQSILLSMVTTIGDGAVNDLESDVSDINSDIVDINGALTASVQFTGGSLVFKNANDTVLYSIAVSTFLDGIVARLDSGAVYAGYAAPSTTPDTLAGQKVFYVATQAGTYIHFLYNGDTPITLAKDGIYFIVSGAGADDWNAEPIQQLDDVPTTNSNNPIKSGAVLRSIIQDGSAFDLSAHNAVGGVLATYTDLSAALTALNSLDDVYKQPGMSFRFVQSNDNKYVQARLMATAFTTNTTQWQGVDEEPTAGSENLVKSGGTSKRNNNQLFFGINEGSSEVKSSGIITGIYSERTYKLIFEDSNWDISSITLPTTHSVFWINAFDSTGTEIEHNLVKVTFANYPCDEEIIFTAPDGTSYVEVNLRANVGEKVRFVVEDITEVLNMGAAVDEKISIKYGVFLSKGLLIFDSTAKTLTLQENVVCKLKGTTYTISKDSVFTFSNISNVYSLWVIVYDKDSNSFVAKAYNGTRDTDIVLAVVNANAGKIIKIIHSVVPYLFDNTNVEKEVTNLESSLFIPIGTKGYINCDNTNKKFVVTNNLMFRWNGETKYVNNDIELAYNWNAGNTSLYKLCIDVENNRLILNNFLQDSKGYPVLFTFYGAGTSDQANNVISIVHSIVPVRINGKDIETRVSALETKMNEIYTGDNNMPYTGEKIVINNNKFKRTSINVASNLGQSMACYDDYVIGCDYNDEVTPSVVEAKLMSLSQGTLLATLELPYGEFHRPHCNVCCFGNEFGSANSIVPLLYVSQWDYAYERGVLVYDIKLIDGEYSVELVQTIKPNITSYLGEGDVDWVVDTDKSELYAFAYYLEGASTIVEGNKEMICKFTLPKLSDGSTIILEDTDVLDHWEMEMFNFSQDKCYNNGKIFVLSGYNTYPQWTKIRVIDLYKKEIVSVVPLDSYGGEPEGMDIVQGNLAYNYAYNVIYKLLF